jgi:hypothetical protein
MAWRTAESLKKLRTQINELAPNRSKASDGTIGDSAHASRNSDHNPWVMDGNTGVVTAMDITHDPDHGCDAGKLVNAIRNNQDSRVKYVIYNRQIMSSTNHPWEWRPYSGVNPHIKHCHISVKPDRSHYDGTADWIIEL